MSETSTLPRGEWHRAEAGDRRAPCPALNALANGGYVPRDGRVTAKQLVDGLKSRLGITWALGAPLVAAVMRELGKPGPDGEKLLDRKRRPGSNGTERSIQKGDRVKRPGR